jgi:hypothetical protein
MYRTRRAGENHMKNPLFVLRIVLAGASVSIGGFAAAQSDADIAAAGRACLAIDSPQLRLACFEGVFGASATVTEPEGEAPAPVADEPRASSQTPAPEPEVGDGSSDVRIVEIREIRPGDVRFVTSNGRIFESTGRISRSTRFPETPFTATFEPGALGSRFLRFGPEDYQRVRVSERD